MFAKWNKGVLDSYLIEITADIFGYKDPETRQADGGPDPRHGRAEGDRQVDGGLARPRTASPLTLIAEAVFARCLSAQKDERVAASKVLAGPTRHAG